MMPSLHLLAFAARAPRVQAPAAERRMLRAQRGARRATRLVHRTLPSCSHLPGASSPDTSPRMLTKTCAPPLSLLPTALH